MPFNTPTRIWFIKLFLSFKGTYPRKFTVQCNIIRVFITVKSNASSSILRALLIGCMFTILIRQNDYSYLKKCLCKPNIWIVALYDCVSKRYFIWYCRKVLVFNVDNMHSWVVSLLFLKYIIVDLKSEVIHHKP